TRTRSGGRRATPARCRTGSARRTPGCGSARAPRRSRLSPRAPAAPRTEPRAAAPTRDASPSGGGARARGDLGARSRDRAGEALDIGAAAARQPEEIAEERRVPPVAALVRSDAREPEQRGRVRVGQVELGRPAARRLR